MKRAASTLARPVRFVLQRGAQCGSRPDWHLVVVPLSRTFVKRAFSSSSFNNLLKTERDLSREEQLLKEVPQLSSERVFLDQIATLSDEQFEVGRRFLASWHSVNVVLAKREMTDAEMFDIQRDFFLVAQFEPSTPVEELVNELSVSSARMPARAAASAAVKRAREAELAQRKEQMRLKQAAAEAELATQKEQMRLKQAAAEAELATQKEQMRLKQAAERAAKRAAKQAGQVELDTFVGSDKGNIIWPLHRILAGMDDMGLPRHKVQALQGKFGWTLSFSRALHSGPFALRKWFEMAGVDPRALAEVFQCLGQEAAGGMLSGAEVEMTPIAGVQRVMCTYTDGDESSTVATSLLMYAPVVDRSTGKDGSAGGQGASSTADAKMFLPEADIPSVMPQVYGVHPKLTGKHRTLYSVPLVLTAPRILLLLRIACGMTSDSRGVQLTGVHGAGKSMLLQALSTVLPVGHPCDMLYVQEARDLLTDPRLCGRQFAQSSGALVDSRATGKASLMLHPTQTPKFDANQSMARDQWAKVADKSGKSTLQTFKEDAGADMANALPVTLLRLKREAVNVHCGQVHIFDEVNELIKGMRVEFEKVVEKRSAQFEPIQAALPWRTLFPAYCFRIVASSPDGAREHVPDITEVIFYELRPARFEHLAAILHAAPHFIHPRVHDLTMAPSAPFVSLDHAMHACKTLCGNMRRISHYVSSLVEIQSARPAPLSPVTVSPALARGDNTSLLTWVKSQYVQTLVDRLVKSCNKPIELQSKHEWEGNFKRPSANAVDDSAGFYDFAMMNASMGVRLVPHVENGRYNVLGQAILTAVKIALRRSDLKWDSPQARKLFARVALTKSEYFAQSGARMESEVQKRLVLQALSPRLWKLDALAGLNDAHSPPGDKGAQDSWKLHRLLRASKGNALQQQQLLQRVRCTSDDVWVPADVVEKDLESVVDVAHTVQSKSNQRTRVDPYVVESGRSCLEDGGHLLISTANNFPRADFILLHSAGNRRSIKFFEVTISTLKKHAGGDDITGVNDSLKDIARLTRQEYLTAESQDGGWWVAADEDQTTLAKSLGHKWTQREKQSLANFWLRLLGCPKRIVAELQPRTKQKHETPGKVEAQSGESSEGKDSLIVTVHDAPEMELKTAVQHNDDVTWDISIVYVSGSKQEPVYSDYADLKCDFAYGVFRQDMDDALDTWMFARDSSVDSSDAGN